MQHVEALPTEEQHASDGISVEQLRHLVRLLDGSDVSEIEVKRVAEGTRLLLRKAQAADRAVFHAAATPTLDIDTDELAHEETRYTIVAPLVGIFHSWAKPNSKPLVSVGDHIKAGQRVGTIQSLNVLNEVESQVSGHIIEIAVQDGQPVEYGQPLMAIDTGEEA